MASTLPHPRKPTLGRALQCLGILMVLAACCILLRQGYEAWAFFTGAGISFKIPRGIGTGIFLFLLVAGPATIRRGSKLAAPRAKDLLRRDHRAPVLLLRSFGDDELVVTGKGGYGNSMTEAVVTLEEAITAPLSEIGPVIAIGRPGEAISPLGAAREYISNDAWQNTVKQFIGEARLIVMVMGSLSANAGLAWELSCVRKYGVLRKLLLVIPPGEDTTAARRWKQYRAFFKGRLPPYAGGELFVTFDSKNNARVITTDSNNIEAGLSNYLRKGTKSAGWVIAYKASLSKLLEDTAHGFEAVSAERPLAARGAWVSLGLFYLTLSAALALLGFILARPFWLLP